VQARIPCTLILDISIPSMVRPCEMEADATRRREMRRRLVYAIA